MHYHEYFSAERILEAMQLSQQTVAASSAIFNLTDINTYIIEKGSAVLIKMERNPLPHLLLDLQQQDFSVLWNETEQRSDHCCTLTNEVGLTYIASMFLADKKMKLIVNGPFLIQLPDTKELKNKYKLDEQKVFIVEEFLQSLKLLSSAKVKSIANVVSIAHSLHQSPLYSIDAQNKSAQHLKELDKPKTLKQLDEDYIDLIELRYKVERELMHAVELGDKYKLEESLSKAEGLFDFSDRLPSRPVRVMKNQLIIINTMLRIAAENGKVPPFYLHHISEKFAIQIERVESIEALNELSLIMFKEYCDLVKNRSVTDYSLLIQKAVSFLSTHYSEPFSLNKVAYYCHTHPAHLSRQFKKETGMTLTAFMNKRRIEEAKVLLKNELAPIDLIAGNVGFNDAVYFTRVFKKLEGITPTEFRNLKN